MRRDTNIGLLLIVVGLVGVVVCIGFALRLAGW